MKVLQIFGWVVAVHLVAFFAIFASPGCSSSPRNVPTPDATLPNATAPVTPTPVSYSSGPDVTPVDLGTSPYAAGTTAGRASPTRPGSPNAVAITPSKPAAEVTTVTKYTVQKGDSLWSIAKRNHLTVAELAKANNLGANAALQPGKTLMIPGKAPAPGAAASAPAAGTTPAGSMSAAPVEMKAPAPAREVTRHTVQSGESLGTIARKYGMTVGELAAANNITDPAKIFVGQSLIVAGGKAPRPSSTASTGKGPVAKPASGSGPVPQPATTSSAPTPAETAAATPHFEIKAPPPGQDLDAGLKENTTTVVPTVKVEEPATTEEPPKK
jgi:LysM repeat protein